MQGARERILKEAAQWYARLCDEQVTEADRLAHATWLSADPAHAGMWRRVEQMRAAFRAPEEQHAHLHVEALRRAEGLRAGRRGLLRKGAALGMVLGVAGLAGWQQALWRGWAADYRTGVGERREFTLPGGTVVLLDSDTALDLRQTPAGRDIVLHQGRIMVTTGHEGPGRDRVLGRHATIVPLGTRFVVSTDAEADYVGVLSHRVEVLPHREGGQGQILEAGEHAWVRRDGVVDTSAGRQRAALDDGWTRGMLVVDDWRLGDFIDELSRYRSGVLRCAPEAAGLRISGAFSLDDTDRTLAALQWALPVEVQRMTRYWVSVSLRGQ
ncbi:MAG: FecR domain-containing protein [Corticimicrobacter sp.]|uniref:FecR domain-containing protein n=1 Tax=Corticimicrobacter sp. TaxID=2678536 RepID=UPI0032D9D437